MGWDYFTFLKQPAFFTEEIMICLDAESIAKTIKNKQGERNNKTRGNSVAKTRPK